MNFTADGIETRRLDAETIRRLDSRLLGFGSSHEMVDPLA